MSTVPETNDPLHHSDHSETDDAVEPKRKKRRTSNNIALGVDEEDGADAHERSEEMKGTDESNRTYLDSDGEAEYLTSPERRKRAEQPEKAKAKEDTRMDESDEDAADAPKRKRLTKPGDETTADEPAPASATKVLRPKKESTADKKKIAQAQADKKNQPSVASFFGGKNQTPPKSSIASFFTKKTPTAAASETPAASSADATPVASVDEDGNITMAPADTSHTAKASEDVEMTDTNVTAAAPPSVSPARKKPTAGKRKRDAEDEAAKSPAPAKKEEPVQAKEEDHPMADVEAVTGDAKKEADAKTAAEAAAKKKTAEEDAAAKASRAKADAAEKEQAKKAAASDKKPAPPAKKPAAAAAASKGKKAATEDADELYDAIDTDESPSALKKDGEAEDAEAAAEEEEEEEISESDEAEALTNAAGADEGFDPVKAATWKQGADVPFAALAAVFERLEGERSRLLTVGWLSDFFRSVIATSPHQLVTVVYLACNQIAPAYEGERTNVGDSILMRAIADATGKKPADLSRAAKESGDLGSVALTSRGAQATLGSMFGVKKKALTCQSVFDTYRLLADTTAKGMSGSGSQATRAAKIKALLVAGEGPEAKFIVRGLQGNLRIHTAEKSVIAALARAVTLTPPVKPGQKLPPPILDLRQQVKSKEKVAQKLEHNLKLINQAYIELPNHRKVIECILQYGVEELPNKVFLEPGIPVKVMLGKPCNGVLAILEKFGLNKFTLEYKYDGARAQIHMLDDGSMKIYSRNSQNDTEKYPELIRDLPKAFNTMVKSSTLTLTESVATSSSSVAADESKESASYEIASSSCTAVTVIEAQPFTMKNFIIDCEVVAWDREQKKILPFQALSTRKKKDVSEENITVQVSLFGFDLLFLNGKSYMNEPLMVRRDVLRRHFHEESGLFMFATHKDTDDADEIGSFMQQAIRDSCEGLMVKGLEVEATYVPNKRNWFKLKKDYMEGVADTLDLVVIGAWHGRGKRTGTYGAFLLATYDPEADEYQSICKIGTGLSDADLTRFSQEYVPPTDTTPEIQPYFKVLESAPRYYKYPTNDAPDVFVEANRVWEIKCADLSISPAHFAAIGHPGLEESDKGIALRFPRLKGERTDKSVPDDLTQVDQVVDLFKSQSVHGGTGGGKPTGRPGGGR